MKRNLIRFAASAAMLCLSTEGPAQSPAAPGPAAPASRERPWLDPRLSPEARARAAVAAMTIDEKLRLIFGFSDQAVTDVDTNHIAHDLVCSGNNPPPVTFANQVDGRSTGQCATATTP